MDEIPLVVVLGAGASFDCASPEMEPDDAFRPPLVRDLFAPRYFQTLDNYPVARHAGAEIRSIINRAEATGESIAIESFIRDTYQNSALPFEQKKYLALP